MSDQLEGRPLAGNDDQQAGGQKEGHGETHRPAGRKKKAVVATILAAVVLLLVGAGVAVATSHPREEPPPPPQAEEESLESKIEIVFNEESVLVPMRFHIAAVEDGNSESDSAKPEHDSSEEYSLDPDGKLSLAGEPVEVALPEGEYGIHVCTSPICEDGSTFEKPKKAVGFRVDGSGKTVRVEIKLAKIDAADMTLEQLEASAAMLEDAGEHDAANSIREQIEKAEAEASGEEGQTSENGAGNSDGGSASQNPENSGGGYSGNGSGGSGSSGGGNPPSGDQGGGSPGGGGGYTPEPAPTPPPVQTYHNECSICGNIGQAGEEHLLQHGRGENASIRYGVPD